MWRFVSTTGVISCDGSGSTPRRAGKQREEKRLKRREEKRREEKRREEKRREEKRREVFTVGKTTDDRPLRRLPAPVAFESKRKLPKN